MPTKEKSKSDWALTVIDFVRAIGIQVTLVELAQEEGSFLPGVCIVQGALVVALANVYPGDIPLHFDCKSS